MKFSMELEELLAVMAPGAKATKCLESIHSTVSDVYVFWLAVLSGLCKVVTNCDYPMPNNVQEDIRQITNYRWKKMVESGPSDVYHAGFVLDPRTLTASNMYTH
jgi:hypothetical protein